MLNTWRALSLILFIATTQLYAGKKNPFQPQSLMEQEHHIVSLFTDTDAYEDYYENRDTDAEPASVPHAAFTTSEQSDAIPQVCGIAASTVALVVVLYGVHPILWLIDHFM